MKKNAAKQRKKKALKIDTLKGTNMFVPDKEEDETNLTALLRKNDALLFSGNENEQNVAEDDEEEDDKFTALLEELKFGPTSVLATQSALSVNLSASETAQSVFHMSEAHKSQFSAIN
mmetsp:Transcript_19225/g.26608  ORF Transcript_19225/g.26608 Transcript_19225/m.26608 type:complete len:118 (-) Transcript_19225:139-492(-)